MTAILSGSFENALTGGLGWDTTFRGAFISLDASVFRHGASSMKVTGDATDSIYGSKTIATQHVSGSVYFRFASLPASNCLFIRCLTASAQKPGITLNPNGKLQGHIGGTDAASSPSTVLSANTWYLIDYKADTSTSTFTLDFKISDTNGSLLSTSVQTAVGGQTAANMTAILHGQTASVALSCWFDDAQATDSAADYPIGAHTSNDGTFPVITNYPDSWIDAPSLIQGGVLFGMMTQLVGPGDHGQTVTSEGATKANRSNLIIQTFYSDINAIPILAFEQTVQNGSLLGHQAWPMINPFGFAAVPNWPAAGLASFADGTLDSIFAQWVTVLNSQLGNTPFLIRPFREMTDANVIYGLNGAAHGGVNETHASFIAAWQHVYTYFRANCPMARFVWCPDTETDPTDTILYYPGDAYVDWIGTDAYGNSTNSYNPSAALTTWHSAYKSGGSLGLSKPLIVCETQIRADDTARVADVAVYTSLITSLSQVKAVCFWDDVHGSTFVVEDTPAGFLSAYQAVVGSAPFLGSVVESLVSEPVINMGIHSVLADGPALLNGVTQSGKVLDGADLIGV